MNTFNHYLFGMVLSVPLLATPVMALDDEANSFVAIENIVSQQDAEGALRPFSDDRLASIEGEGICIGCSSINVHIRVSPITQFNVTNQLTFAFGRNISQSVDSVSFNNAGRPRGGRR